jgi:hypothetical protein
MKKLREYKGVTYSCGFWYGSDVGCFSTAASVIVNNRGTFSDDDHAELMRLKAEPYEPMPRLEDVVYEWLKEEIECRIGGTFPPLNHWRLIDRLRTAFPHIDQEER